MPSKLDDYLDAFRRELRGRGIFGSRILEEVRSHVLDAAEAEEQRGLTPQDALDRAYERVGSPRDIAVALAIDGSLLMQKILFAVAITLGLLLGYVESRPTWDDTGVTAGLLLIGTVVLGALAPQRPWLWALCMGLWIPVFGIFGSANYGSLIALAVAFAGAYAGMLLRRVVIPA